MQDTTTHEFANDDADLVDRNIDWMPPVNLKAFTSHSVTQFDNGGGTRGDEAAFFTRLHLNY